MAPGTAGVSYASCTPIEQAYSTCWHSYSDANHITRTVGITPRNARGVDFDHVRRVCHDHTLVGLKAMLTATDKQFRFLYMSGSGTERDQNKKPWVEARYMLMRVSIHIPSTKLIYFYSEYTLVSSHAPVMQRFISPDPSLSMENKPCKIHKISKQQNPGFS